MTTRRTILAALGAPLGAALLLLPFAAPTSTRAQSFVPSAPYHPARHVSGTITIWGHGALGHDYMNSLVEAWEAGFKAAQPGVTFDNQLHGTASAIGALYTGKGDIALMGRDIWPMETNAFEEVHHYPPLGIDILTGSLDIRNKGFALVAFANAANPIQHFSLRQMERIFGAKDTARTWGDLGLTGDWAKRPIHAYGFEIHRGFGYYMQQKIFRGSPLWNPEMVELGDAHRPDGALLDAGQRIVDAVAKDPDAVGYSSLLYKNPRAKPLSIGPAGGPFVAATQATVEDHTYPLYWTITCYINRAPGKPVDPKLAEFLRYILSEDGRAIAAKAGGYMPLTPSLAARQLRKLE